MFSVVIPLYNKEKYILRAVESVLAQTYKDFELIVVDDGSTDNSLLIIQNIDDSRIKIINQLNQGVGSARNTGISNANSAWVALLDADDAWAEDHLMEINNIVSSYPQSGMVATKILELNTDENIDAVIKNSLSKIYAIDYFDEASKKIGVVHSSSVSINKEVFKNIGGFSDKKMGEDLEYWAKVALSYPVAISEKTTACYFKGTQGAMESQKNNRKTKYPSILNDISPSLNLIMNESKIKPSILKKKGIRNYINSRLFNAIRQSLFKDDIVRAKSISKLALPQADYMYIFALVVTASPKITLQKAIKVYKRIK